MYNFVIVSRIVVDERKTLDTARKCTNNRHNSTQYICNRMQNLNCRNSQGKTLMMSGKDNYFEIYGTYLIYLVHKVWMLMLWKYNAINPLILDHLPWQSSRFLISRRFILHKTLFKYHRLLEQMPGYLNKLDSTLPYTRIKPCS